MTNKHVFWHLTCLAIVACCLPSQAAQPRSKTVLAEFQRQNPCPSTGKTKGACEGWIKDHITPLCAGGSDSVDNLQWQTVADAKRKDVEERKMCARSHN